MSVKDFAALMAAMVPKKPHDLPGTIRGSDGAVITHDADKLGMTRPQRRSRGSKKRASENKKSVGGLPREGTSNGYGSPQLETELFDSNNAWASDELAGLDQFLIDYMEQNNLVLGRAEQDQMAFSFSENYENIQTHINAQPPVALNLEFGDLLNVDLSYPHSQGVSFDSFDLGDFVGAGNNAIGDGLQLARDQNDEGYDSASPRFETCSPATQQDFLEEGGRKGPCFTEATRLTSPSLEELEEILGDDFIADGDNFNEEQQPNGTAASNASTADEVESTARRTYKILIGRPPKATKLSSTLSAKPERKRKRTRDDDVIEIVRPSKRQSPPKRDSPPLMPKDKPCFIYPAPITEDIEWSNVRPDLYLNEWWISQNLPCDGNKTLARDIMSHILDHFNEDKKMMRMNKLPVLDDPGTAARMLIRYANDDGYFEKVRNDFGEDYYQKLMDPNKKELYGHIYFKIVWESKLQADKSRKQSFQSTMGQKDSIAPLNENIPNQQAITEAVEDIEEQAAQELDSSANIKKSKTKPKFKKPNASTRLSKKPNSKTRRYGNDGKIIHERGSMRREGKKAFQRLIDQKPEEMEAHFDELFNISGTKD